jgi:hypothetical protein
MPDLMERQSRHRECAQATQANRFIVARFQRYLQGRPAVVKRKIFTNVVGRTTAVKKRAV